MSWKNVLSGKGGWRDLIACLSVANLWLVKLWLKILPYHEGTSFFLPCSPLNTYLAALLNVVTWGLVLFVLVRLCRARPRLFPWLVLGLFFITCIVVAYGVGAAFFTVARFVFLFGPRSASLLAAACWLSAAMAVALLVRYRKWLARHYAVAPLLFAPYLLVTVGESVQAIAKVEPPALFHPHRLQPAAPLRNRLGMNVVWVIFDETDYRLGFGSRPPFLSLPAFDALKATSLFATEAYSPNDNTQTSLPSLLTGLPLKRTVAAGADRLVLEGMAKLRESDFSSQDTIFRQIKERGGSTALLGWFLPYGRTMKDVDLCHDYPRYNFYVSDSLLDVYLHQWREMIDMRFLLCKDTMLAGNQIGIVRSMRGDVGKAIKGNDASLMFLHFSVPHSPNIYDRRTGSFGFNRDKRYGYFDNLALADRCLAELRGNLEERGLWDKTLVIVSSDHHWRTNTYDQQLDRQHVPFLAKLPGQRRGITYHGRFNTIVTKELILRVVDHKISSPEEACRWLDRTGQKGKTPIVFSAEEPDAD